MIDVLVFLSINFFSVYDFLLSLLWPHFDGFSRHIASSIKGWFEEGRAKENFLWHFGDFQERFLIKGLYLPHYYQNGSLLAVLPSVLFHLFPRQHFGVFIYQVEAHTFAHIFRFSYQMLLVSHIIFREKRLREIYRLLFLSHPARFLFSLTSSYFRK